jgi:hypothetical protein
MKTEAAGHFETLVFNNLHLVTYRSLYESNFWVPGPCNEVPEVGYILLGFITVIVIICPHEIMCRASA